MTIHVVHRRASWMQDLRSIDRRYKFLVFVFDMFEAQVARTLLKINKDEM